MAKKRKNGGSTVKQTETAYFDAAVDVAGALFVDFAFFLVPLRDAAFNKAPKSREFVGCGADGGAADLVFARVCFVVAGCFDLTLEAESCGFLPLAAGACAVIAPSCSR
eukprot:m.169860 g.169860  ORF g.169860 m.169860 type:complete len:109 (-) comp16673_c0_seq1:278-604(-)